jgi:hypothetical protein
MFRFTIRDVLWLTVEAELTLRRKGAEKREVDSRGSFAVCGTKE